MKIKLDLAANLIREAKNKAQSVTGLSVKFNKYRFSVRPIRNYETDTVNNKGEVVHKGEDDHWWEDQRKGLYQTALIRIPFTNKVLSGFKQDQPVAVKMGMDPNVTLDWIVDEFDHSFNDLAIASLKYHMDYAVTHCSDSRRETYENLVERLSAPHPGFTDEEMKHFEDCNNWGDSFKAEDLFKPKEPCKECDVIYEKRDKLDEEFAKRMNQARHDFVDIMPSLWS